MKLGDKIVEDIEVIPTGSIGLDLALGVGGYPRGRVIEIYGPESSGKTTLTLHAIAEAQKNAYAAIEKIAWDGAFYRDDIAYRAIARENRTETE